jgi:hypothetical protein
VAYKSLDLCDGGDLQSSWIVYQLALLSNQLQSAWIMYQWMLTVISTVGSMVDSTCLCWAIALSKAFDSSDEKLNKLVVLQTCFTGFIKQTPHLWAL